MANNHQFLPEPAPGGKFRKKLDPAGHRRIVLYGSNDGFPPQKPERVNIALRGDTKARTDDYADRHNITRCELMVDAMSAKNKRINHSIFCRFNISLFASRKRGLFFHPVFIRLFFISQVIMGLHKYSPEKNDLRELIPQVVDYHGTRNGDRTRTPFRKTDFKSVASAIPPPGQ